MTNKSLDMYGPYKLQLKTIDSEVPDVKYGNYALGYVNDSDEFIVKYVGRSDNGLADRIKDHIGEFPLFKFSYCETSKQAFDEECRNWHEFGGPDGYLNNKYHPDRPNGKNYRCKYCDNFDD